MSLATIALLVLALATEIAREIYFKAAANNAENEKSYFKQLFKNPKMWLGLILWAVEIISWVMVLARAPLSMVFPMMSLCYVGVLVGSWWFLGEKLSVQKWLGVISITVGVAIVGTTGI